MTLKSILSLTNNSVALRLIDTNREVITEYFPVSEKFPEDYLFREIKKAEVIWEKKMIDLITDTEKDYRETHEFTNADGKLQDLTDTGEFTVLVTRTDGSKVILPYKMTMDPNVPDRYCNHFVMDGRDYYFG